MAAGMLSPGWPTQHRYPQIQVRRLLRLLPIPVQKVLPVYGAFVLLVTCYACV